MGFFDCLPDSGDWKCVDKIDVGSGTALPCCPVKYYPTWADLKA